MYSAVPTLRSRLVAFVKNFGMVFYGYYALHAFDSEPTQQGDAGKELHRIDAGDEGPTLTEVTENIRATLTAVQTLTEGSVVVRFVHLPLSYQVHVGDTGRFWDRGAIDPFAERIELTATIAKLEEAGLPMILPLDALIAEGENERMYFWLDIHLTPDGNRVVAEEVVSSLLPDLAK